MTAVVSRNSLRVDPVQTTASDHCALQLKDLRGALECGDRAKCGNKGGSSELHD